MNETPSGRNEMLGKRSGGYSIAMAVSHVPGLSVRLHEDRGSCPDFLFFLVLFIELCYNENDGFHACRTANAGEWYHFYRIKSKKGANYGKN